MWAVLGTIGTTVGLGALGLFTSWWMFGRDEWNWEQHEYPARPTGEPSPRAGLDDPD